MKYTLLHGDCLIKMKEMDNNSVDAIVTDPPYGLSFMSKKWLRLTPHTGERESVQATDQEDSWV